MNALGGVVCDQLGRGVVGVQFNLVDSGHDLAGGVTQQLLQVLDAKVGDTDVANLASGRQLLQFLPATGKVSKDSSTVILCLVTYQVLIKSQSGKCFDLSSGSVELGQCIK